MAKKSAKGPDWDSAWLEGHDDAYNLRNADGVKLTDATGPAPLETTLAYLTGYSVGLNLKLRLLSARSNLAGSVKADET